MKEITEAQTFITRKCNHNCGHCKIVEGKKREELGIEEWKEAHDRMKEIGIKTNKHLGGEPTIKEGYTELLEYSSRKMKIAVLSNSSFDDAMAKKLVDAGLWGYFASVDGLDSIKTICKDAVEKSQNGYKMLHKLKKFGVPLLAANVVINRKNMDDIPKIIQVLSDDGFYVNLCLIQHTTDQRKEFSRTDVPDEYKFSQEDKNDLKKLSDTLLRMKRSGTKISIPESYIKWMLFYGINCDWQCDDISQLRIDSDGGLMLCNEYRTELADKYNILDMTPEKYARFLKDWKDVRKTISCDGCYWSCFIQAKDNIENNRREFHYINSNKEVFT